MDTDPRHAGAPTWYSRVFIEYQLCFFKNQVYDHIHVYILKKLEKYHPAHIISRNGTNSPKNSPLGPFLSHYLCFRILSTIYFGYFNSLYGEQCQIMNNICRIGTQLCATNMYFELSNFFLYYFLSLPLIGTKRNPYIIWIAAWTKGTLQCLLRKDPWSCARST